MDKLKGSIAVFIGGASFGILSTFVKKAYEADFDLGEVVGIQVLLGMLILWVIYFSIKLFNPTRLNKYPGKTSKIKILVSGFSTGAVSMLYYQCVQLVPASIAIILLMQYIWIGILIEWLVFKNKPSNQQIVAVGLILFGTLLATGLLETHSSNLSISGVVYGLLSATAYAVFLIVNGRVGNDYAPIQKSAIMITGSFILIMIILQPISLTSTEILNGILPYGILLAAFGTIIPPLLFAYGMPKTGFSMGNILTAVELPVAITMSYFILHEYVSLWQWVGVILILLIIVWLNKPKGKLVK